MLDPHADIWLHSCLPLLPCPISDHAACAGSDANSTSMYVSGGWHERTLSSLLHLDTRSNARQWHSLASMRVPRQQHSCVAGSSDTCTLYAVGGFPCSSDDAAAAPVEVYDARADRWCDTTIYLPVNLRHVPASAALILQ